MLKANVGLSRKVSRDYCSTGFSVNLEGELTAPVSDPDAVIEQIRELYDLAEEALCRQIDRYEGESAIASRDEPPRSSGPNGDARPEPPRKVPERNPSAHTGRGNNGHGNGTDPPATEKQVQYLLAIGKRRRLGTAQLEAEIARILGQGVGLYELTKRQAGTVIDTLTGAASGSAAGHRD